MRVALGIAYRGDAYHGWQSQPDGRSVQDALEAALAAFVAAPVRTVCAGRTDTGVHALNQVLHLDTDTAREAFSWVRGTNRYLPGDIAVQWAQIVPDDFHARNHARGRRYAYVLRESAMRPALETGLVGWAFRALDGEAMRAATRHLIGTHDFSALRSSECQAASPVKELRSVTVARHGAYWRFDFDGSAFLHHMIRNIMGCLLAIGQGRHSPDWMAEVIASRSRDAAAPTFSPAGLYFLGPYYDASLDIPEHTPAFDWLPA
ncbi:MAG: tRNA pseudouridine(38-40) synthase TruA [Pseudomonadota bacterium]|jgi:tRNA pseudouridine38-40 synthase